MSSDAPDPAEDGVPAGTQLNGIYEIDVRIAAGGMGEVYRGHNIQTGDLVAIKVVLPDFATDPLISALFRREATVLNHLSHNAIVRYHLFSIDPGIGRPYLAMEFVDGTPLTDAIAAGPMPPEEARRLVARVASGLAAAHEAGVIHRDLSPDNIILTAGGVDKAKIIDFGIARSQLIGGETVLGGRFAGKYNFVSPEQIGLFGGEVDERSDIYSLGLVLAAALRGAVIDMGGTDLDVVEKRRVVPPLDGVPEELRGIVEAMLQPDPKNRPADMSLVHDALVRVAPPEATAPPRPAPHQATVIAAAFPVDPPPGTSRPAAASTPERAAPAPAPVESTVPPVPVEEPYRYIASNPPDDEPAPGTRSSSTVGAPLRRAGRGRGAALAASLVLVLAGGAGAWLFDPTLFSPERWLAATSGAASSANGADRPSAGTGSSGSPSASGGTVEPGTAAGSDANGTRTQPASDAQATPPTQATTPGDDTSPSAEDIAARLARDAAENRRADEARASAAKAETAKAAEAKRAADARAAEERQAQEREAREREKQESEARDREVRDEAAKVAALAAGKLDEAKTCIEQSPCASDACFQTYLEDTADPTAYGRLIALANGLKARECRRIPDGRYAAVMTFPPKDDPNCRPTAEIAGVEIAGDRIEFRHLERLWRGRIDQATGDMAIEPDGIEPTPLFDLSIRGSAIDGAAIEDPICGPGTFKLTIPASGGR